MILSDADTTLAERFRDAGLITLGRTNSPELASVPVTEPVAYGPTRNPWDTGQSPGGSSGGAAAAVAAGMVPIAHASDGGGRSVSRHRAGPGGLKPSQGRVTVGPRSRPSRGLEHAAVPQPNRPRHGPHARRGDGRGVGDTVIAATPTGPYSEEVGVDPGRLRIGLLDTSPDRRQAPRRLRHRGAIRSYTARVARPPRRTRPSRGARGPLVRPALRGDVGTMAAMGSRISARARSTTHRGRSRAAQLGPRARPHASHGRRLRAGSGGGRAVPPESASVVGRRLGSVLTPTLAEPPLRIGELYREPGRQSTRGVACGRGSS